jgi:multidrug efflux system membrane fusion protein
MRSITVGVTDGNTAQVQGINPGDVLADSSFDKLQDNAPVSISKQPLPSGSSSGSSAP